MTSEERVDSVLKDVIEWLQDSYSEDMRYQYKKDLFKVLEGPAVDGYHACKKLESFGWDVDFHLAEILDLA